MHNGHQIQTEYEMIQWRGGIQQTTRFTGREGLWCFHRRPVRNIWL